MSLAIDDGSFPLNSTIDRNNSNYQYNSRIAPVRQAKATMISSAT